MSEPYNLIGQKYGKLTVIERGENNKRGNTRWICKCDCGKEVTKLGYDLTHGKTTSCGCGKGQPGKIDSKRQDLTGKRFGKLEVIKLDEDNTSNGIVCWICKCDCGNIKSVRAGNLRTGHTKSCGMCNRSQNKIKDLTGNKYGRLTVIELVGCENHQSQWLCKCKCGNTKIVSAYNLKSRATTSCGCLLKETRKKTKHKTHGMTNTRIYSEYRSMINRCSPKYHCRSSYYDKEIKVYDEWLGENGFLAFYKWSIENGYDDTLTLDRINNDKGYSPYNCRWVDMKVQQNNKTTNVYIEYMGETKTMREWCDTLKLDYGMVKQRRRKGWKVPRLFEPPHKNQYQ